MNPLDAAFLYIEDSGDAMHIGSASIFEGPAPSHQEFVGSVGGKLPLVPRYRQKVRMVPWQLGRPVWVDDPHFNIDYHIRRTALPSPGDDAQLRTLVARLMAQRLDRNRPLWEMWVVEGLSDDRWAAVYKVHHCMVDGVAATDLLAVTLDLSPEPSRPIPDRWRPAHEPYNVELLADAAADRLVSPYEQLRGLRAITTAPTRVRAAVAVAADALRQVGSLARPLPSSSLIGPVGQHRRWEWVTLSLADVKSVRRALGGTVNDVVLSCVTGGFRTLLRERGETVEGRVVRSFVPVSVRNADERGAYNNRVSGVFADLPVGVADPQSRLASIRAQMDGLKEQHQAVAGEVLTSLGGFAPPLLLAMGTRAAFRLPQRGLHTVTTNIPGPQFPLYSVGRRMLAIYPYVPVAAGMRIVTAIFSYNSELYFGVTGDWDGAADLAVLRGGVEDGLRELLQVTASRGRGDAPPGSVRGRRARPASAAGRRRR